MDPIVADSNGLHDVIKGAPVNGFKFPGGEVVSTPRTEFSWGDAGDSWGHSCPMRRQAHISGQASLCMNTVLDASIFLQDAALRMASLSNPRSVTCHRHWDHLILTHS
jgi:hypothetical protein